jgi:hypothetical protein
MKRQRHNRSIRSGREMTVKRSDFKLGGNEKIG